MPINYDLMERQNGFNGHEFVERADPIILKQIKKGNKNLLWVSEEKKVNCVLALLGINGWFKNLYGSSSRKRFGRIFGQSSIGSLFGPIKNTLFSRRPELKDIDMENGGITIIYQIGRLLGVNDSDLTNIKHYIKNREECLSMVETIYKVDKCIAKQLFIIIANGGTVNTWIDEYEIVVPLTKEGKPVSYNLIEALRREFKIIGATYLENYPDAEKVVRELNKGTGNIQGKALAELYQDTEEQCLEILMTELGFPLEAYLQHDGATVNMDEVSQNTDLPLEEILKRVTTKIKRCLGLDVVYRVKPFGETLKLGELDEDEVEFTRFEEDVFEALPSFAEKKRYFEIFHFFIKIPEARYYYQKFNRLNCKDQLIPFCETGLKKAYKNLFYKKPVEAGGCKNKKIVLKDAEFINDWMEKIDRRGYDDLEFIPKNEISKPITYWDGIKTEHYNSFRGYSRKCLFNTPLDKETKAELLEPWIDLVFEICGAEQKHMDAYLDFLAHLIQKPNEKFPKAIIIKSLQGVGKNVTLEPIGKMLGEYYLSCADMDAFSGTFNNGFFQKILVNMNECQTNQKSLDYEGKLKSWITEEWMSMNEKFEKRKDVRNIARILGFTNKQRPFPLDVRSVNRRLEAFQSTEKYSMQRMKEIYTDEEIKQFWIERIELFKSDDFIATLYEFLSTRDISKISTLPIITAAYIEMCAQYTPIEVLYLEWLFPQLEEGFISLDEDNSIGSSELYKTFEAFAEQFGVKKEVMVHQHKFTLSLQDLNVGITSKKVNGLKRIYMDWRSVKKELIIKLLIRPDENEEIVEEAPKAKGGQYKSLSILKKIKNEIKPKIEILSETSSEASSEISISEECSEFDEIDDIIENLFED
jgi:hypothetical protein